MARINNIVVPTDFSPLSEVAELRAATLADFDGAQIHLLHVMHFPVLATPYEVSVPNAMHEGVRQGVAVKIEEVRKATQARTKATVTAEVVESGDPVRAIAEVADSRGADLVAMGTHGHGGLQHAFLGSVTERALRALDRPVLAVKGEAASAMEPIQRIVLAADFSSHSDRAAEVAADLAEGVGASVELVHAYDLPHDYAPYASGLGTELIEKIQQHAAEELGRVSKRLEDRGVSVTVHCRRGHPSVIIAEVASEVGAQLIAMGTRGATGLAHVVLGSVAERTIRTAPCSVLAVKAGE